MATHHSTSSIKVQLRTLLSLLLLIQIVTSFVINARNTSSVDGRPSHKGDDAFCANSPEWEYQGDQESDCITAIQMLHDHEVRKHGDHEFEFVPDGFKPRLSLAITKTPRKYMYETCTVAIVVLNFFTAGDLPGIKPEDWGKKPTTDLASYQDIWRAAQHVERECVRTARKSGWQPAGRVGGIGLFVWSTNSAMNRKIPAAHGPHAFHAGWAINSTMAVDPSSSPVPENAWDWIPASDVAETPAPSPALATGKSLDPTPYTTTSTTSTPSITTNPALFQAANPTQPARTSLIPNPHPNAPPALPPAQGLPPAPAPVPAPAGATALVITPPTMNTGNGKLLNGPDIPAGPAAS